jgi:hypothetical protein
MNRRALAGVIAAVSALSASGCKGNKGPFAAAEAGIVEAGADGAPVHAAASPDSGAPPDDLIPPATSEELTARGRHLLEAMSKDDPDLGVDLEFPRVAWLDLRDAVDPAKDWDKHVDRPFRRTLHALSRHAEGAQFVSLELGHAVVQDSVKKHGWKKALWSVHGSKLTYLVDGHTRTVSIREMTAWRGAWYVTRLR